MGIRLGLNILLAVAIVATVAGGVVLLFSGRGSSDAMLITLPEPTAAAAVTVSPTLIKVYISGEVNRPGVYELSIGSRAEDALKAAGGSTSESDLVRVNLARRLSDGEQLHIPRTGEAGLDDGQLSTVPRSPRVGKLDLNTATVDELVTLPQIGQTRARAIVDYREVNGPFKRIGDLVSVPGIAEGILDSIRDLVEVR